MQSQFKALGHEVRLTIYRALRESKLCVCELTELLEMSQPAVSQHLSVLREAGLIESERRGQWTFYSRVDNEFATALDPLLENSDPQLTNRIEAVQQMNLCTLRDSEGQLTNGG